MVQSTFFIPFSPIFAKTSTLSPVFHGLPHIFPHFSRSTRHHRTAVRHRGADEQRGLLRGQRRQAFEDLGLGLCVHGRSGLIQDEPRG